MKQRKSLTTIVLALTVLMTLSLIPALPVHANGPTIYLVPSNYAFDTSTATLGTLFNVTVWVNNVPDPGMIAYQITINYNDTLINATRWFEPTTNAAYVFFGRTTLAVPSPPTYGYLHTPPDQGAATVGASLFPYPGQAAFIGGPGLICIVEFKILKLPSKYETLNSLLHIDKPATYILDPTGTEIPSTKVNGNYTIAWVTPPIPTFAVTPTMVDPNPAPTYAINLTSPVYKFNVTLYIAGLDPAWGVTSAWALLNWNTSRINVTAPDRIWIDSMWGNSLLTYTPGILPALDTLNVTVWTPTGTPGGNQVLAIVEFEILVQGDSPPDAIGAHLDSPMNICDSLLMDHVAAIATNTPINGIVVIHSLMALPLPYFELVPKDTVLGPEPSIGKEFCVDVVLRNLSPAWHMIAWQFRLCFDDLLISGVSITEGPLMLDPRWDLHGTTFVARFDSAIYPYPPCAVVADVLWPDSNGVWAAFPGTLGPGVSASDLAALGIDPPPNPVVATICFTAIQQITSWPPINLTCNLEFQDFNGATGGYFIDRDNEYIPSGQHLNGTYTIVGTPAIGKVIDLYGGVEGNTPYPVPYGGQGPNQPMDMVWPQKEVYLYANVTYNFWPVQNKVVSFEVEGPFDIELKNATLVDTANPVCTNWTRSFPPLNTNDLYHIDAWTDKEPNSTYPGYGIVSVGDLITTTNWMTEDVEQWYITWFGLWNDGSYYIHVRPIYYPATNGAWFLWKDTALTDQNGVAVIHFRMPWQCFDAESFFGIYKVTATVDIACEVITDRTYFHYDYRARITKVTTDKFYYGHCKFVTITVDYATHSMQWFDGLFFVGIKDELDQPIGYAIFTTRLGGATFCKYKSGEFVVLIHVPKWAFSGYAFVHANLFDKDPSVGGQAWCPEYTCPPHCPQAAEPLPTIYILPIWDP